MRTNDSCSAGSGPRFGTTWGIVGVVSLLAASALGCKSSPPTPAPPVVTSFTATPSAVPPGSPVVLAWVVSGAATVQIDPAVGAVTGATATVNPTTTTTYVLTASNDGGTVTATAKVIVASNAYITAGNGKQSAPGTAIPESPRIVVVDSIGTRVPGIPVTFAVGTGGGSVQSSAVTTDFDGFATCGTWTLGPDKGLNTLTASVSGIAPLTFVATAVTSSPLVRVYVNLPGNGGLWPAGDGRNPGLVAATVASTYSIASAVATIQSFAAPTPVALPLTYGRYKCAYFGGCDGWIGTPALDAAPWGPALIVVTATDVLGNSADGAAVFAVDRTPVVTVGSPLEGALARPTVQVTASCTDDDPAGCAALRVSVERTVVASGKGSVSQSLDLSAYEGKAVNLTVTGNDSAGQEVTVSRTVYVESSPALVLRNTVPGTVWDVLGSRILFLDTQGTVPALRIRDTSSATESVVESSTDLVGTGGGFGYLTRAGAIYVHGQSAIPTPNCWLYDWGRGSTTPTQLDSCESLAVADDFAIYSTSSPMLYRRNLVDGSDVGISSAALTYFNDVATNGDVVFWSIGDYQIYRWRAGTTTALTNDSPDAVLNTYPVTDGTSVLYRKSTPAYRAWRLAIHDGTTERILASDDRTVEPIPHVDYAIQGGWAAYTRLGLMEALQVWRHGLAGEEQLTFFSGSSQVDGLAPDGTVIVRNFPKRHLAAVGSALKEIGSTLGTVVYRDGKFFVLMGPNVLEVVP